MLSVNTCCCTTEHSDTLYIESVTNVKLMKSILLTKEKLCLYIHESLEYYGSPWKLTIANTSGGE